MLHFLECHLVCPLLGNLKVRQSFIPHPLPLLQRRSRSHPWTPPHRGFPFSEWRTTRRVFIVCKKFPRHEPFGGKPELWPGDPWSGIQTFRYYRPTQVFRNLTHTACMDTHACQFDTPVVRIYLRKISIYWRKEKHLAKHWTAICLKLTCIITNLYFRNYTKWRFL